MAIMKWGTPPKGSAEDRRAHVVGHGENVKLAHAAFGSKVVGNAGQISDINENYGQATRWLSTAPYRGDDNIKPTPPTTPNIHGYRDASRAGKCMANNDTCNGNATVASERKWCAGHTKTMARLEQ